MTAKKLLPSKFLISVATLIASVVIYQNCGSSAFEVKKGLGQSSSIRVSPFDVEANSLTKATTALTKTLLFRLPTSEELNKASTGLAGYEEVVNQILNDPKFKLSLIQEHRDYLEIGGRKEGEALEYDEPALLGAWLVDTDQDYNQILLTEKCVSLDEQGNWVQNAFCSSVFPDQSVANQNSAGVVTTRAYLKTNKSQKAFNFRLVSDIFLKFNCSTYPDLNDRGLTPEEISNTLHPFSKEGAEVSKCFTCHRSLNSKAYLFFNYDREGQYTTDVNNSTKDDGDATAKRSELLVEGVMPRSHGVTLSSVKDIGQITVNDPRFAACVVKRYVNFMLGQPTKKNPPFATEELVGKFSVDRNVKLLLKEIAMSKPFIHRSISGRQE